MQNVWYKVDQNWSPSPLSSTVWHTDYEWHQDWHQHCAGVPQWFEDYPVCTFFIIIIIVMMIILYACVHDSRFLVDQGCIPLLCDLLTVTDRKIVQMTLSGLENILFMYIFDHFLCCLYLLKMITVWGRWEGGGGGLGLYPAAEWPADGGGQKDCAGYPQWSGEHPVYVHFWSPSLLFVCN